MKQKLVIITAILTPLMCLIVCVWKFERAMARPRLDHALIAAIQRDDAITAVRLLAQGANPNACDAPPPPSFWRWMLRFWRPDSVPFRQYPTAMQIAFARAIPDIAEENPPYAARLRIIQALHERGAKDTGDAKAHENELNLFGMIDSREKMVMSDFNRSDINRQCGTDAAFLQTHGVSMLALEDLALAHYLLGDVDGAAFVCRLAQVWEPQDEDIAARLALTEQRARVWPRNAELIAAVRRDDAEGVSASLRRGADPNAQDIPAWADTRAKLLQSDSPLALYVPTGQTGDLSPELQDKALEIPKRATPSTHPYPTALKIAVYRDMTPFAGEYNSDDDPEPPKQSRFAIIKALHDAGASPAFDLTEREKSLPKPTELELGEKNAADFPRGGYIRFPNNWEARDEAQFLIVNGMSARAYAELAKYCARFDADEWAVHAYHVALLWKPNDAALANAARRIEDLPRVRRAIQQIMPAHWKLEKIRPYPSAGKMKFWAALYSRDEPDNEAGYHCAVYGEGRTGFTLLFRGKEKFAADGVGVECALYVLPLTGRKQPEIIGQAQGSMAGAAPAQMIAYAPEGNGWKRVLEVSSNQGIWLERRRGERAYIVRNGYETGSVMCHAEQPCRLDVYAWNGKEYVFADPKYPELFRKYIKEAEEALRQYPADEDLPYHLAYLYSITGRKRKAERYYRRAERACRKALAKETDADMKGIYARELKEILTRRAAPRNRF